MLPMHLKYFAAPFFDLVGASIEHIWQPDRGSNFDDAYAKHLATEVCLCEGQELS